MTILATTEAPAKGMRMSSAAVVRLGAVALSTLAGIALARWLGPEQMGVFEASLGQAALLGVIAVCGVEKLVVREIASASGAEPCRGAMVVRWARRRMVFAAVGVVVVALLAAGLQGGLRPEFLVVAGGLVPLAAWMRVQQAELQGRGRVIAGQGAELLLIPGGLVVGLWVWGLADWGHIGGYRFAAHQALLVQAGATAVVIVVGGRLLHGARAAEVVPETVPASADVARWRRASAALLLLAALQVLHARADIVLFAMLAPAEEVGRFAVAWRVANLVGITLLIANSVIAPQLARAHALRDPARMRDIAVRAARWSTCAALPVALITLVAAVPILGVFGDGYAGARSAMTVLVIAQVVNVAMGSVGLVLLMSGNERAALPGLAAGAIVDFGLLIWLAPIHGATGAAVARGAGLCVWNLALAHAVRRRLGVGVNAWTALR